MVRRILVCMFFLGPLRFERKHPRPSVEDSQDLHLHSWVPRMPPALPRQTQLGLHPTCGVRGVGNPWGVLSGDPMSHLSSSRGSLNGPYMLVVPLKGLRPGFKVPKTPSSNASPGCVVELRTRSHEPGGRRLASRSRRTSQSKELFLDIVSR